MLKPITDADVPDVVSLMNRAYRGSGTAAGWSTQEAYLSGDRTSEDLLRADLAAKPGASFLIWHDPSGTRLQGCVWLEPLGNGAWYLGSLAVDPDRHDRGLGKILLASAEQWVRERGGRRVRMAVINVRQALMGWYVRRGYIATGETTPFLYGDDRYGQPLRDDLAFTVLEKDLSP